jgi:hypothetical protein
MLEFWRAFGFEFEVRFFGGLCKREWATLECSLPRMPKNVASRTFNIKYPLSKSLIIYNLDKTTEVNGTIPKGPLTMCDLQKT